ncbi:hypothetical protein A1354_25150 [Pseudomonas asplenii]|nr:hypothetical protein A1354_25150 [Pseudomonas asplenii]
MVSGFFVGHEIVPPHPSPLPQGGEGEREPIGGFSESEFGLIFQVDVSRPNNSVSPLSLWGGGGEGEREPIGAFQNLSSAGYFRSMDLE